MTLEMCRIAQQDGITHIVATPHANDRYRYDRNRHAELLRELQEKAPGLHFSLGCDFFVSYENIEDAILHPARYAIAGTHYLLVEFSDFQTAHSMTDVLFRLHSAGFGTVITHPERNPVIVQYPDLPSQFVGMGSLIQITADSLTGAWGRSARKMCETLLKNGLVAVIASDAHEPKRRKPVLSKARKAAARIVGEPAADRMVQGNPCAILNNQKFVA